MGALADLVIHERGRRNAAREHLAINMDQVKLDLEARGVGGRVADKLGNQAKEVYDEALAIAGDNKGIVGGTIAALTIWFLKSPIVAALDSLMGGSDDEEYDEDY